jgi:hypothetical protein
VPAKLGKVYYPTRSSVPSEHVPASDALVEDDRRDVNQVPVERRGLSVARQAAALSFS